MNQENKYREEEMAMTSPLKQQLEDILFRIDCKKQEISFDKLMHLLHVDEFLYPSSKGEINSIHLDLIHPCINDLMKIKKEDWTFNNLRLMQQCLFRLNDLDELRIFDVESVHLKYGKSTQFVHAYKLTNSEFLFIQKFIFWLNNSQIHVIKLAILMHIKFLKLHPFKNGNGRIAHLFMNIILNKYNYPCIKIDNNFDADQYFRLLYAIDLELYSLYSNAIFIADEIMLVDFEQEAFIARLI